ncbi:unnamed protein product [Bubo scandiacus]
MLSSFIPRGLDSASGKREAEVNTAPQRKLQVLHCEPIIIQRTVQLRLILDAASAPGDSGLPLLTVTHPQRFQKTTQPLRSWRTATARDMAGDVVNVPFAITLSGSDFTATPHGSGQDLIPARGHLMASLRAPQYPLAMGSPTPAGTRH